MLFVCDSRSFILQSFIDDGNDNRAVNDDGRYNIKVDASCTISTMEENVVTINRNP